jgi:pyruvate ferredoxin oxidoreductase alpha subunit
MMAVDKLQAAGQKVGLLHLRLWRPFPYAELRAAVKHVKTLIVLDRAISMGQEGPVATEVKNALYSQPERPQVVSFVAGMGGRDISPVDFENIIKRGMEIVRSGSSREFEIYGVRE